MNENLGNELQVAIQILKKQAWSKLCQAKQDLS